jgi:hypothetical protein
MKQVGATGRSPLLIRYDFRVKHQCPMEAPRSMKMCSINYFPLTSILSPGGDEVIVIPSSL